MIQCGLTMSLWNDLLIRRVIHRVTHAFDRDEEEGDRSQSCNASNQGNDARCIGDGIGKEETFVHPRCMWMIRIGIHDSIPILGPAPVGDEIPVEVEERNEYESDRFAGCRMNGVGLEQYPSPIDADTTQDQADDQRDHACQKDDEGLGGKCGGGARGLSKGFQLRDQKNVAVNESNESNDECACDQRKVDRLYFWELSGRCNCAVGRARGRIGIWNPCAWRSRGLTLWCGSRRRSRR